MSRPLLTLSSFGLAAAAGVAAWSLPSPLAALVVLCCGVNFALVQRLRDAEVAVAAEDALGARAGEWP